MDERTRHRGATTVVMAIAWLLLAAGCASPPARGPGPESGTEAQAPSFPTAYYQARAGSGQVYRLRPEDSRIAIHAYRAGALAAQGHNHVIVAEQFQGAVHLPDGRPADGRLDLLIPAAALAVDPPQVRQALGGGFARPLSEQARRDTGANMLGEAVLDAARFPDIGIRSTAVAGELPELALTLQVTLRGVAREQLVPVRVEVDGDRLLARGALAIRQSDFGIQPFRAAGGLLQVADEVTVRFELVGHSE
ncbi:MAG TPA: YceI family protein [Xanthomonadaceae bacterium]|nr:YceI family protein [Xanthomonadaceae bacterium]